MTILLVATGGFLLAVLWMDLMFDVQVTRLGRTAPGRDAALASIAAYYRRVTTDAFPMNRLIGGVMVAQLAGIAAQAWRDPAMRGWRILEAIVLGVTPIAVAGARVFPDAVRLGSRRDDVATQVALARRIFLGHMLCFVGIAAFIVFEARLG